MFNYYYYTNSYYMLGNILVLVGVALMALAQMKVSSAYNKYSKVQNSRHLTGYDVAREILDQHGLSSVQIFEVQGRLSDHYNPSNQTLHLSRDIYHGTSIASLAVAAHECGHALQHQEGYRPLTFRNAIVPVCNFSYNLGWVAIMIGLFMGRTSIAWIGVLLTSLMLLVQDEYFGAKKMLTAAALTYVAGMLSTLLSLLRIVLVLLGNDRGRD